jgi:3-oxoacyl-[acyl-carrier protein] reductase
MFSQLKFLIFSVSLLDAILQHVQISTEGDRTMASEIDKTALITGASGGIGQSVAKKLASQGFAIVLHYGGNPSKVEALAAEIEAAGSRAILAKADVENATEVELLFQTTTGVFGKVDVVVHTAGIMPLFPIDNADLEAFDKVIGTNLRGTFLVMAHAAKQLPQGGRLIVFSSSVLTKSFPGYGAYIASKAGVEGLVHVLANELRGRNITVNAVAPGPVATDLFLKGKSQDQVKEFMKLSPLERVGEPCDIANVVAFLAGSEGAWVNSQVIRVNGGFAY